MLFSKWAFWLAGALHPLFSDCLSAANAWQVDCSGLAGGERAAARPGPGLKDTDYCFPPSLIEALERKDFNLLSSLSMGPVRRCHQDDCINSSERTPLPSSNRPLPERRGHVSDGKSDG